MPHAEIASKQALHSLQQLHAELAGKLKQCKKEQDRIIEGMKQVEATMKLLDPSYSVKAIAVQRRQPNKWFKRGTMYRAVMDVLRTAEKPLSTDEIATALLRSKGVSEPTREQRLEIEPAVAAALRVNRGKSVDCTGQNPKHWFCAQ